MLIAAAAAAKHPYPQVFGPFVLHLGLIYVFSLASKRYTSQERED